MTCDMFIGLDWSHINQCVRHNYPPSSIPAGKCADAFHLDLRVAFPLLKTSRIENRKKSDTVL